MNRSEIIPLMGRIAALILLLSGCSVSLEAPRYPIATNSVCIEWGTAQPKIEEIMKGYEQICKEDDFVCYGGKNGVDKISYHFNEDGLCASMVIISSKKASKSELKTLFKEYEHLGERRGFNVYFSESANTIGTVSMDKNNDIDYYVVGYVAVRGD